MRILITKDGRQLGPYSVEEVQARLQTGEFLPGDLAWHEGLSNWVPVAHILGGGAWVASPAGYAGFWRRVLASLIDGLVLTLPVAIFSHPAGVHHLQFPVPFGHATVHGNGIGLPVIWVYFACMESSRYQATMGKMALGLYVTDESGARIGFGRATGRYFGKILSGLLFGIGFLMAGFTVRKQALHDMIAGCLVLRK